MTTPIRVGVNLNNRELLLVPTYNIPSLIELGEKAERLGFDSLWLGDSLTSKPRPDPLLLLAVLASRTSRVQLGTACLVAAMRDPLYLSMAWSTLDVLADGRTILGACAGNVREDGVKREFDALGIDHTRRVSRFEETLQVLRSLWTEGSVTFHGEHFDYDQVEFFSGTEVAPLAPLQKPPPIWVVSNPGIGRQDSAREFESRITAPVRRILTLGDGWMTCCRAKHPEELEIQLASIHESAGALGRDLTGFEVAYQVTMNVGATDAEAESDFANYIATYYREFGPQVDLGDWGPVGSPEMIIDWMQRFAAAGVTHFICRFASPHQHEQVERFAQDVLPALQR